MPLQHSKLLAHTSDVCAQKDPLPEQSPLLQNFEQHCPWSVHALPSVRHEVLSGVHVPIALAVAPAQFPPQHSAAVEQGLPSDVHWVPPQVPPLHTNVQQSCGMVHAEPAARH
jgi:hypothetical protein